LSEEEERETPLMTNKTASKKMGSWSLVAKASSSIEFKRAEM